MPLVRLWILSLALFAPFASAGGQDEEIVREFNRYFRKYKDTPTRVEAVLALLGSETPSVVGALVPVIKKSEPDVVRAAVRVLSEFKTRPPVEAVFDELESNKDERVRMGLLEAIEGGSYRGGEEALRELLAERSWEVRRRAVLALAAAGEGASVEAILLLAADSEPAVRCAVLDGLSRMGSVRVIDPALGALEDPVWQVRACAIAALKRVRNKRSIEPLIRRMEVEEGRLLEDLAGALEEITGRGFGQRREQWQRFWDTYKDRFEIPTDLELAKLREKQRQTAELYKPSVATTYHGIDTPSRAIVFVIDVSGSMENLVTETERFADGGYPSFLRIDIVKTELARTLENLEPYVRFNVLAFATDVKSWKKSLVPANVLNKSSAVDWVRRLQAIGGASKEDLANVGLVGSANLEAGKTNTHAALMAALGVEQAARAGDYQVEIDTVFFLSDGRPSHGEYVDPDDILRQVRTANELRQIVIHTIAIGEFQKTFMRQLAEQNGGVFVDLGK